VRRSVSFRQRALEDPQSRVSKSALRADRALLALGFLLACTTEANTDVKTVDPTVPPPDGPTVVAEDLTAPVAQPQSVFLVVRAPSPERSWRALNRLQPLPIDLEKELAKETSGLSGYVDLSESFDVAVGVDKASLASKDPKFFFAASVPLKPETGELLAFLEKKGDRVESLGGGRYRIASGDDLRCELWTVRAPRLVCAEGSDALRELSPWMARTLPTLPKPTEDLSLMLDFAPAREDVVGMLTKQVDAGLGELEEELADAGLADREVLGGVRSAARHGVSFLSDLGKLEVGLTLEGDPSLSTTLSFRSKTSWFTRLYTDGAVDQPAPDVFFRLPKDADAAFFGRAADPSLFDEARGVTRRGLTLLLDFAEKESSGVMDGKDKQAFLDLFDAVPSSKGAWVLGAGPIPTRRGVEREDGKPLSPAEVVKDTQARFANAVGYFVAGGDGDAASMIKFVSAAVEAEKRLLRMIKADADKDLKNATGGMKDFYKKKRAEIDAKEPKLTLKRDPAGYPKGSAVLEATFQFDSDSFDREAIMMQEAPAVPSKKAPRPVAAPPPPAKGTLVLQLAIVPDEGGKFVYGISADAETLKKKLLGMRAGGSATDTIASRPDLARLKKPLAGGGFVTLGGPLTRLAGLDPDDRDSKDLLAVLQAVPSLGKSPVFWTVNATPGDAPSLKYTMTIDRTWVRDLGTWLLTEAKPREEVPLPTVAVATAVSVSRLPKPCEDYLTKLERCATNMPADAATNMREALAQSRKGFTDAAQTSGGSAALAETCKTALDAVASNPVCK
jgi:hypothetical protein